MHDKSAPDRSAVRTDTAEPAAGRPVRERMTALERRATASLAGIYGLRMLGMFIILPVFALYAETLPGGRDHTLVGIALGAYGLTQAILQIPFGWASDRFGRKPTIVVGLLLFAFGSFVAAWAPNIWWTIAGRSIQGAGAISAAVIALTADLTRHEVRTRAMAAIGMTIGATFALSLILGPVLKAWIGVPGIFVLTGVLALGAIVVLKRRVPDPDPAHVHPRAPGLAAFGKVLADGQLLRLNYGIFALHALLMALFVQVPFALRDAGLVAEAHWKVYLPVMVGSVLLMLPLLRAADRPARSKAVFMGAVLILLAVDALGELQQAGRQAGEHEAQAQAHAADDHRHEHAEAVRQAPHEDAAEAEADHGQGVGEGGSAAVRRELGLHLREGYRHAVHAHPADGHQQQRGAEAQARVGRLRQTSSQFCDPFNSILIILGLLSLEREGANAQQDRKDSSGCNARDGRFARMGR